MIYRMPQIGDGEMLKDYVREHLEWGETRISASRGVAACEYGQWLEILRKNDREGDEKWGRSLLQLCLEGERLIGLLDIRYLFPPSLSEIYGDIGYGVRPSERNRGYATAMLSHALEVCRERGRREVLLGCYKENLASARVIQKNGGVLVAENDNYTRGVVSQYFRIWL